MRIFLASIESGYQSMYPEDLDGGNFFTTFYTPNKAGEFMSHKKKNWTLVVDSGAHAFFSQQLGVSASSVGSKKQNRTDPKNVDKYVDEYVEFIHKYKDFADYFVELDIDKVVGKEKMLELRQKLDKAAGRQLIPCYHPSLGTWKENKKELLKYEYIGIEGIRLNDPPKFNYLEVIKDCYLNGTKCHGFAMTKKKYMGELPFYSVDSSSWQAGVRFGRVAGVNSPHIQVRAHEKNNIRLYHDGIMQYRKLEDYYTKLWIKRGIDWAKAVGES